MNKTLASLPTIYPSEVAKKGDKIYNKLRLKLEKESYGRFVAIEIDSEKYFIADRLDEALKKAKNQFPKKVFYTIRIGYAGAISVSASFHSPSYESIL